MKKLAPFLIVVAIIIPFSPWEDTHWPKWMMFHFVAAFILGLRYAKRYTLVVGLAMFTTIVSGAQVIANRETYLGMHQILRIDLSNMSGKAVVAFLLMIMMAETFTLRGLRELIKAYFWICTIHCLYVLFQLYYLGIERDKATGFLPNVSMGPSMLAVLYPLLITMWDGNKAYKCMRMAALFLFPLLVIREGSSIAWATFMVGIGTLGFLRAKSFFGWWKALQIPVLFIIACAVFGPMIDSNFFRPEKVSRFVFWPHILKQWWENSSHLLGAGTGAFRHLGPNMQQGINFEVGQWWYWAHNDWLQILFETGILGFISALGIWVQSVIRSYRFDYGLCSALIALSVVGFGNYFLRLAEFCFLVMILIAIPLKTCGGWNGLDKRMASGN